jgi:hypothetical protein
MAGAGIRLFEAGEILTADLVNSYLMDQVIPRFATATTRNSSFGGAGQPTLGAGDEGRLCYLDSTNEIQYWNGSTWVSLGDQAVVGIIAAKGDLVVGTTANTITNLTVGVNGKVLTADSSTATGVAWGSPTVDDLAVTSAKIANLTIVDGNISATAAISLSKLATGALPTAITVTSANISDLSIVNADISASAAIAYSKLSLGTSIVNADVSTSAAIVDTKLATISTAGKVSNSATTATDANTASAIVARDASGNFIAGKATLATADINTVIETASIVASASTGTINIDFSTNPTVYYTSNATNDWTLNVRGTSGVTLNNTLTTGQIATVTFLATIGTTQKRPTVFQVDGSAVTPKWMGGTAPATGNASSIDAYTLAIIKTGSAAFTVLASQTKFA